MGNRRHARQPNRRATDSRRSRRVNRTRTLMAEPGVRRCLARTRWPRPDRAPRASHRLRDDLEESPLGVVVDDGVRIAELVGTLSYAADLGLGQPMDHCLRQTVIAGRLAELAGASDQDRATTFYLGLLMNTHCHADAAEQATWFDDDIGFKSEGVETLGWNTAQILAFFVRRLASHGSASARARRLATFPLRGQRLVLGFMTTHAAMGARFAERIGLDAAVGRRDRPGLRAVGRQGRSRPAGAGSGSACPRGWCSWPVRWRCSAAATASTAAVAMARRHRGTQFDPALVDLFCASAAEVLDDLDAAADWDAVLDVEPEPCRRVSGGDLDVVLEAMADLADLKSPTWPAIRAASPTSPPRRRGSRVCRRRCARPCAGPG